MYYNILYLTYIVHLNIIYNLSLYFQILDDNILYTYFLNCYFLRYKGNNNDTHTRLLSTYITYIYPACAVYYGFRVYPARRSVRVRECCVCMCVCITVKGYLYNNIISLRRGPPAQEPVDAGVGWLLRDDLAQENRDKHPVGGVRRAGCAPSSHGYMHKQLIFTMCMYMCIGMCLVVVQFATGVTQLSSLNCTLDLALRFFSFQCVVVFRLKILKIYKYYMGIEYVYCMQHLYNIHNIHICSAKNIQACRYKLLLLYYYIIFMHNLCVKEDDGRGNRKLLMIAKLLYES